MANVLSLAMKINADASGFKLDPVQRALVSLGEQADKVTAQFDKFAGESEAATRAQGQFADQLQALQNALRDGSIGATRFAIEFEKLTKAANAEAAALERAARITEANITPQQKYERTVAELKEQLDAGRISQDTFSRAMDKAKASLDGASDSASKTDKNLASLNANVGLLTKIEIGRALIDGFQALSGVFQRVTGQITSLVSSVNSSLDTLNDFSARTGIGVEALQGYSLAAKLAGVDTEQFGAAVQKLGVNIGKANPGDAFDKSLRGIGLSVAELGALAPEQQFSAIGEAISQLPTAADRAAAAVEIFGRQGAALAPLFRDGAASIEELRAEAQQLGAIVSETQINNVASMNDAFDKVRATVQGIVGQVIGNLAPAVADVTNQFLEFVKNFNGGEGGTGIANAITDVLLQGAAELAKVFDYAVAQFNGFSGKLASASDVFATVGNIFSAVGNTFMAIVESLRATFNLFELAGNKLMEGLGNFLAGLGSYVSSDLELVGRSLAAEAKASAAQNFREMNEAAENYGRYVEAAAQSAFNVFSGDAGSPSEAGKGAASRYIKGMQEELARGQLPEVKVLTGIEGSQERLRQYLKDAGDGADKFLQQSEATLDAFQKSAEAGNLTSTQVKVMLGFMDSLNEKLDTETTKRRQAADEAKAQAEADQKRLDALLKPTEGANKLEQDIAAVYREQARVQEQLAAARAANSQADADQAAARLAELDQLQAKLEDIQQAQDQGFSDGFQKSFAATSKSLDSIIDKAAQFGNEGAKAAQQLQEGITRAQEQVRAGILSQPAYEAEVANQRRIAEERLGQLDREAKARQAQLDAEFQQQVAANERLNQFLLNLDGGRQRAEAEAAEQAFNRRKQAAENLEAIENRIALQRKSVEAAREQNDLKAAKARQDELRTLERIQKQEKEIAEGRGNANRQLNRAANAAAQAQIQQQQVIADTAKNQIETTQRAASNAVNDINQAFAAAADAQRKLFKDLNTLGSQTVQTADVRTQEGAAIVLGLAANAQDPRLIEQRLANKILRQIATGLTANLNRIGIPATLL